MTETREAPTPREVEIDRIAAALGNIGTCGHSSCPRDTSRHRDEAAELFDLGLRFPVPPDPAVRDNDNAGPEAALNHLRESGGPKRDSGVSARTAAKGMSGSQQAIFESGYAQGRADAITDTLPVPPDPGTAAKVREAEARPADGWHLTHSCGGFRREITRLNKGEAFMCVVCGEWCRVVVTPEARALLDPEPKP